MNAIGLACVGKYDSARAYAKKLNKTSAELPPRPKPVAATAAVVTEPQPMKATVCYATESTFDAPHSKPAGPPPPSGSRPARPHGPPPKRAPPKGPPPTAPPPQANKSSGPSYMKSSSSASLPAGRSGPAYLSRESASTSSLPPRPPAAAAQAPPRPPPPASSTSAPIVQAPIQRKTFEETKAQAKGQHHALPRTDSAAASSTRSAPSYGGASATATTSKSGFDMCFVCQNAIVMAKERVLVDGKYTAHASCFKCAACARTLDPIAHDYDMFDGMYYCLPHHAWILEEARKEEERKAAGVTEPQVEPGGQKKWKMNWTTKKWTMEPA